MSKQQTLLGYDPEGFGDLQDDPLCEHCGRPHQLSGRYCGEKCSHGARRDPDGHKLVEYEPEDELRMLDRDDCVSYWECSRVAANEDRRTVCDDGCKRFIRDTTPRFSTLRSNASLAIDGVA